MFNTTSLPDAKELSEFKIVLTLKLQTLHYLLAEEEITIRKNWKEMRESINSSSQELLDPNKH